MGGYLRKEAADFIDTIDEIKFNFSNFVRLYNIWNALSEKEQYDVCNRIIPSTKAVDIFLNGLEVLNVDFKTFRRLFNIWISLKENERIEIYRSSKIMKCF